MGTRLKSFLMVPLLVTALLLAYTVGAKAGSVPYAAPGQTVLADNVGASNNATLAKDDVIYILLPEGVCFVEGKAPKLEVSGDLYLQDVNGDPTQNWGATLYDTNGDGCYDKARWVVYADNTTSDNLTVYNLYVQVSDNYTVEDTSEACGGTNCDNLTLSTFMIGTNEVSSLPTIAKILPSFSPPQVIGDITPVKKTDNETIANEIVISLASGLTNSTVTISFEAACAEFYNDGSMTVAALTDNPDYSDNGVSVDSEGNIVVANATTGDLATQIALSHVRVVTDNCPLGDLTAVVKVDDEQIGTFVVAKVKNAGTETKALCEGEECTEETLPEVTRGAEAAKTLATIEIKELFGDELAANGTFKVTFPEGVTVANGTCDTSANATAETYEDNEVTFRIGNTDAAQVDTITITCNATVADDFSGSSITASVAGVDDNVTITAATVTVGKVVAPNLKVEGPETPSNVGIGTKDVTLDTVTISEEYYGSLAKDTQLVIYAPEGIEIVSANATTSCDLSDPDANSSNGYQGYLGLDKDYAYWVVNSESAPGSKCSVDIVLTVNVADNLQPGTDLTFEIKATLSDRSSFSKNVVLGRTAYTTTATVEAGNVNPDEPNLQALGTVRITENYDGAILAGKNFRVVIKGVSDADLGEDAEGVSDNVSSWTLPDGMMLQFTTSSLPTNDDGMHYIELPLMGIPTTDGVITVDLYDCDVDGENCAQIHPEEGLILAVTNCSADNLEGCGSQTECEAAGLHWYDDACHAEPAPVCDAEHLDLCTTEEDCTAAGGHWYMDACHAQAPKNAAPESMEGKKLSDWPFEPAAQMTISGDDKKAVTLKVTMNVPAEMQGQTATLYYYISTTDGTPVTPEVVSLGEAELGETVTFDILPEPADLSGVSGSFYIFVGCATQPDLSDLVFNYYEVTLE